MNEPAFRCGADARERGDDLAGTAAPATSWLLIEHPGPWPRTVPAGDPAEPGAGSAIAARARSMGMRPLFVRRHGRRAAEQMSDARHFTVVTAGPPALVGRWSFRSLAEVASADWAATEPLTEPLYLTCTHGRHDRCCAIAGRPVAAQFAELRPDSSWDCSHLGGDRFAGNVLVLPTGATYGFVDPLDVPGIITATEAGEVQLRKLRGLATDPPLVQAARVAAQQQLGRPGAEALRHVRTEPAGTDLWLVHLADATGGAVVTVERQVLPPARATCAHSEPVPMQRWHVLQVTPA